MGFVIQCYEVKKNYIWTNFIHIRNHQLTNFCVDRMLVSPVLPLRKNEKGQDRQKTS
jgi:hypothetical protein